MPKKTIMDNLVGTTTAAGIATLYTNRLRPGQVLCIQHIALLSNDTANTVCNLSVERAGQRFRVKTITLSTDAVVYSFENPLWIESDCRLEMAFTAGGNSKPVYAWVYGYLIDPT